VSTPSQGLPDHEQQAWDAIVADLRGEIDLGPQFPAEQSTLPPAPDPEPAPGDGAQGEYDPLDLLDEGYEPPHPPPLPRPADAIGRFSWAAVLGGPALVLLVTVLGWDRWMANLGVALTVGGFVSLVWRMKDRDDDDGNDGAVV
jgi:hypothetical protein